MLLAVACAAPVAGLPTLIELKVKLKYSLDSCVLAEEQCASSRQDRLLLGEQIAKDILSPLPALEALVRI